ncbi:MAG: 1-deoxy-D-xylulose-5-phosphate reductoisomerase, partial [Deltaproteobacteria bacterium]|nr:1-deoxy-D-xylulose-5-phosphate reductoisomerase [Deltaproteobacteria bacterium]
MKKIRLSILGATGSIGRSALSVIGAYGDLFEVIGLSCGKNYPELYQHIRRFAPDVV